MTYSGVLSTNHTSFTVSDLNRSIAFFRDVLGFTATPKLPRSKSVIQSITGVDEADVMIAYLRGPGHTLELIEYLGPPNRSEVRPRPCDVGFAHIAFDVDDIDAAVAASKEAGVLPLGVRVDEPVPDPLMSEREVPSHVADWIRGRQG